MPQSIPLLNQPLKNLGRALSLAANRDALRLRGQSLQQVKSEQGVTLLECLVAISVIAILGAMIGPPLVFTAATRLQNQRAEQAFQIAQAEVDRLRVLVARGNHIPANLPPVVASLNAAPAPTAVSNVMKSIVANCPGTPYTGQQIPINEMLRVDTTGDCQADFLVQLYRTNDNPFIRDPRSRPINFSVGVRVYSAKAAQNRNNLSTRPANLRFAAGQGDLVREGRDRGKTGPLAVFNSDLIWTDRSGALCDYRQNPRC